MKKSRKLLIVTTLLMALSFIIPAVQSGAEIPDEGITVCCILPPSDTIGLA